MFQIGFVHVKMYPTTIRRCWVVEIFFMFQKMRDQNSTQSRKNASSWDMEMKKLGIRYGILQRKISSEAEIVFFKDQNIKYIQKEVKLVIFKEHPINLDPIPPLENYGGDEIEDVGDAKNETPINNGPTKEVTDGNKSADDNEDIIEYYKDEE